MVDCVHWPDVVPTRDKSGLVSGRLTFTHPVARAGAVWYYLADCSCGEEYITRENGGAQSCGCLRGRKVRGTLPTPTPATKSTKDPFDRSVTCIHGLYKCLYYVECQDDRFFSGKKVSARYEDGGRCYVPTPVELEILEGT